VQGTNSRTFQFLETKTVTVTSVGYSTVTISSPPKTETVTTTAKGHCDSKTITVTSPPKTETVTTTVNGGYCVAKTTTVTVTAGKPYQTYY
jgi:hypothetical protein